MMVGNFDAARTTSAKTYLDLSNQKCEMIPHLWIESTPTCLVGMCLNSTPFTWSPPGYLLEENTGLMNI